MTDLFSKFDPLIQQRETLLETGLTDPFNLVMERVESPTVSISACMFIVMMTSNSSSILATKSSTVRLSHSRSWAKRVASVTATPFLLKGSRRPRVLAYICWRSGMVRCVRSKGSASQRSAAAIGRGRGG